MSKNHRKNRRKPVDVRMTVGELMEKMEKGEFLPGPIRHRTLPPALLTEIQRLWYSVGKAFFGDRGNMEQWELCFIRDCDPSKEVMVWQRIERASRRYMADHPAADLGETVTRICLCSMGALVAEYHEYWDGR